MTAARRGGGHRPRLVSREVVGLTANGAIARRMKLLLSFGLLALLAASAAGGSLFLYF